MKQVLVNLIGNAIKFTNEGLIRLTINAEANDEDTATIKFSVKDTGIGIPNDKLDLIFERFEQLDNAFIRQQGGTGLGLAITKMIIESMGGHIAVSSEPGKGSAFIFSVRFKINKQPLADAEMHSQRITPHATNPSQKSILLAEDNRVNQLLVHKLLSPYNIEPVIAENGQDVLILLENNHFDLILMDVQMPLLDGITTTRLIRKYVAERIPIVGMTAYVLPNEIEKCYAAGMNDHIPKPIDEQHLLNVIKKYIYLDEHTVQVPVIEEKPLAGEFAFLSQICNGNEAAMNTILDALETQLPIDKESFEKALKEEDHDALRRVIHHMKSTVSPLGTDAAVSKEIISVSDLLHTANEWTVIRGSGKKLISVLDNTVEFIKNRK